MRQATNDIKHRPRIEKCGVYFYKALNGWRPCRRRTQSAEDIFAGEDEKRQGAFGVMYRDYN